MNAETLLPCPFCGHNAYPVEEAPYCNGSLIGPRLLWIIECMHCESTSGLYDTKEDAINAWNDRKESDTVEYLKKQLEQLANFNPDWDMLKATQESLVEYMKENKKLREVISKGIGKESG